MYKIKETLATMLPQERLETLGPEPLSNAELLAIILRTGTKTDNIFHVSQRILDTFYNLHDLKLASLEELQEINGVGKVKSAQIKAMIELGRRIHFANQELGEKVTSSFSLAQSLISQMKDYKQEHLMAIFLNTQNAIIRKKTIFVGTLDSSIAHPREIFRDAVKFSASSIILVHNHPSGEVVPSQNDYELTKQIIEAGKTVGIPLLDHLIVGSVDYYSFRENGDL